MRYRIYLTLMILLAVPALGQTAVEQPLPVADGAGAGTGPARPAAEALRTDLETILSRPEYRDTHNDWMNALLLRLAQRALTSWRHFVSYFAQLHDVTPVLYWLFFTFGCVIVLLLLYHIYLTMRSAFETAPRRRQTAPAAGKQEAAAPDALVEAADDAAARGDYSAALRMLYLALIRHLDRQGLIRYDISYTNRQYLKQAAEYKAVVAPLTSLTEVADIVWYGRGVIGADEYARCQRWASSAWEEGTRAAV